MFAILTYDPSVDWWLVHICITTGCHQSIQYVIAFSIFFSLEAKIWVEICIVTKFILNTTLFNQAFHVDKNISAKSSNLHGSIPALILWSLLNELLVLVLAYPCGYCISLREIIFLSSWTVEQMTCILNSFIFIFTKLTLTLILTPSKQMNTSWYDLK